MTLPPWPDWSEEEWRRKLGMPPKPKPPPGKEAPPVEKVASEAEKRQTPQRR